MVISVKYCQLVIGHLIMYAVWQGNPEIIKFLVEKGAKIDSTDTNTIIKQ